MFDFDDASDDIHEEAAAERRRAARRNHWCSECHGHTGPNSPCYSEPEEERAE